MLFDDAICPLHSMGIQEEALRSRVMATTPDSAWAWGTRQTFPWPDRNAPVVGNRFVIPDFAGRVRRDGVGCEPSPEGLGQDWNFWWGCQSGEASANRCSEIAGRRRDTQRRSLSSGIGKLGDGAVTDPAAQLVHAEFAKTTERHRDPRQSRWNSHGVGQWE